MTFTDEQNNQTFIYQKQKVKATLKCDHIERQTILSSYYIKRLLLCVTIDFEEGVKRNSKYFLQLREYVIFYIIM